MVTEIKLVSSDILAGLYGASIGSFAVVSADTRGDGWMQLLPSTIKAPLLFYLTLLVTFPSQYEYVFNALMGSRWDVWEGKLPPTMDEGSAGHNPQLEYVGRFNAILH